MTLSIPQPIPSRSSHPVHAHQRPPVRRSQSHSTCTNPSQNINASTRFGLSRLLTTSDHRLHQSDIGDELTLTNEDDEDEINSENDDDDDDDDDEEQDEDSSEVLVDSGHYSSDLDLAVIAESRGIPIGKPNFLYSQKNANHLYGTAGGSVDSKSRMSQGSQSASSRFRYSHSHSNSDSHHSINLISNNLKATTVGTNKKKDDTQSDSSFTHFKQFQPPSPQQQQQEGYSKSSRLVSPSNNPSSPPSARSPSPTAPLPSPSLSPDSTHFPQRATLQRHDAQIGQLDLASVQGESECSHDHISTSINTNNNSTSNASPDILKSNNNNNNNNNNNRNSVNHNAAHYTQPISIDTSKARLHQEDIKAPTGDALPALSKLKQAASTTSPPKPQQSSQSPFGLKKEEKPAPVFSPSFPASSTNNSSTRPLMMASQSRLSSALPPTPTFHQQFITTPESVLSPSSPRANSALVNSLEQLSVSWKAPENTPSFPINRLHRSRTISTGARPSFPPSFSSNGSSNSSGSMNPYQSNNIMSPNTMVTSSSYSSLPYSPAVAFLSNFVDVTAPRMAPDEEGEQVGDFIMGKIIGHGGFSLVREAFAIHLDGLVASVAVKIVKAQTGATDNDRIQRMLDKEIAIWSRLSHPNVLPFVAVEKLPSDTFVFCELCTGGNLLDYLTKQEASSYMSSRASGGTVGLDETHARLIFNQIAEAVRYLHEEKRIVHRDIKLENILQHEDGTWKICDFGLAEYQNDEAALYFGSPLSPTIYNPRASSNQNRNCQQSPSSLQSQDSNSNNTNNDDSGMDVEVEEEDDVVGGSLAYCSPEQLRSPKPLRCPSTDVWSLGVVLYALLTGRLPFQDEYEPRLQFQILNGRYEDPTECSAEARDLLKNMFKAKAGERLKIGQVIDHPWCINATLEGSSSSTASMTTSFGGFGGSNGFGGGSNGFGESNNSNNNGNHSDHAKMNNFFATFRF
ncbi:hypothetical protein BX616_003292 [Lobosporangium transversale]|nr:hypothetical protein BX616_003292 [Lobosporangium transversale]